MGKYKHARYSQQRVSLWDVLLGVLGCVWPSLPHSLCMSPKWDRRGTHLAQVQKGSTLQRIFVFDDGKPKGNVLQIPIGQSHALLISPGRGDWKIRLRQGTVRVLHTVRWQGFVSWFLTPFLSFSSSELEKNHDHSWVWLQLSKNSQHQSELINEAKLAWQSENKAHSILRFSQFTSAPVKGIIK